MRLRTLRLFGALALVAAPLAGILVLETGAGALTFNVTNTNDSGDGSLRKAIADAAANAGDDIVAVQAGLGTITLSTGPIVWNGDGVVTINGNGITLNAGGAEGALLDLGGDGFTVNDMTITGAALADDDDIAPLLSEGGNIVVHNCNISGNVIHTTDGDAAGAILSEGGSVSVDLCTIMNNTATADDGDVAGAILSEGGNVVVTDSTITGNSGTSGSENGGDAAGGIASEGGTVTIATSTISGNHATAGNSSYAGGGVLSSGNSVTVRNSTLNCNSAVAPDGHAGGGIIADGETVTINGSQVQGNTAVGENAGDQANGIFVNEGEILGTGNTIDDNFSVCAAPTPPPPVPAGPNFTG